MARTTNQPQPEEPNLLAKWCGYVLPSTLAYPASQSTTESHDAPFPTVKRNDLFHASSDNIIIIIQSEKKKWEDLQTI